MAEERTFHYIADEELDMLALGDDGIMEQAFWASSGVFFGSLLPVSEVIVRWKQSGGIELTGLLAIGLIALSAGVALASATAWRQRRKRVIAMQGRIRARTKVPVQSVAQLDGAPLDHP